MSLITAKKGLGKTVILTVLDAAGVAITPGANDLLRVRIMRQGEAVAFEVVSGTDTAAGSSITKNSPSTGQNTLRMDATDLGFDAGIYSFRFDYFDNADASEWKKVQDQVFSLEDQ